MAKKKTSGNALIYLVLDKSGSMESIRQATIDGCNRFINETKDADANARISLLLFDTEVLRVYEAKALSDIEPIDGTVYSPSGGTALLDAIGHAVKDIEDMADQPSKVVVAILTDGAENSSREYTRRAIQDSVARHETENNWQFLFLGANLNSFAEAGAIGSSRANNSLNWQPTAAGAQVMYASAGVSTRSYLSGATATADLSQASYDSALKDALSGTDMDVDNTTLSIDEKVNRRGAKRTTK